MTVSPTFEVIAFLPVSDPTRPLNTTWVGISLRMTSVVSAKNSPIVS
jgi:hypothetical protein